MAIELNVTRALQLIQKFNSGEYLDKDIELLGKLINLANIEYHNTDTETLSLPDTVYDEMMEIYNKLKPPIIGAEGIFGKRMVDTEHKYPKLKGELNKVKYVTDEDRDKNPRAKEINASTFEKWLANRLNELGISKYEVTEIGISYKYDGISIVSETSTTILSALTRGKDNKGADVTDVLKNYEFRSEFIEKMKDVVVGVKWEAIITFPNLQIYNERTSNQYKNPRSAIVGIFGRLDAAKYADLVTLVPIETSYDMDRNDEVPTLNALFANDVPFEYIKISGDFFELVKKFKMIAEKINENRPEIPYMIDGLVIEFTKPEYRAALGRIDNINQYQIAYKFPDQERVTAVTGMSYSVGYTGKVVPMVHYNEIYFNGTTHDKTSLGSYGKFKSLNLSPGQDILVKYSNDVLCDVFNVDKEGLGVKVYAPYEFPTHCPICSGELSFSESEATCVNSECPAKLVGRIYNFVFKMNMKNWGPATVQMLYKYGTIKDISDVIHITLDDIINTRDEHGDRIFGDVEAENLYDEIHRILETKHVDSVLVGSLGLASIGRKRFEPVFSTFTLTEVLELNDSGKLYDELIKLDGFAYKTATAIVEFFSDKDERELIEILMKNLKIIDTKTSDKKDIKGIITFTNFRDDDWVLQLESLGYKVDTFSKKTALLVHDGYSKKVDDAAKWGIPTIARDSFSIKDVESYIKK